MGRCISSSQLSDPRRRWSPTRRPRSVPLTPPLRRELQQRTGHPRIEATGGVWGTPTGFPISTAAEAAGHPLAGLDARHLREAVRHEEALPAAVLAARRHVGHHHASVRGCGRRGPERVLPLNGLRLPEEQHVPRSFLVPVQGNMVRLSYLRPRSTLCGTTWNGRGAAHRRIFYFVRRGGLEPPRCYPLAPQASASANSATFAFGRRNLPVPPRMSSSLMRGRDQSVWFAVKR